MRLSRACERATQQLLGRRLADRAGDSDDAGLRARARRAPETFERDERIFRDIERAGARERLRMRLVDRRRRRAGLEGLANIVVAVAVVAFQRDKQIAFRQRARVDRYACNAARRQGAAHPRAERRDERERGP